MYQHQAHNADQLLYYELEEEESLLWFDRPGLKRVLRSHAWFLLCLLPWLTGCAWILYGALAFGSSFFPLGLIPIFPLLFYFAIPSLVALYIPIRAYLRARSTIYALTNRRILVIIGRRKRTVRSYRGVYVGHIERVERAGERGDLVFGPSKDEKFIDIANTRSVENLLIKTFQPQQHFGAPCANE
jgi:hypothetical protein